MSFSWIDKYVSGVIEHCGSRDVYEIYNTLDININRIDKDDPLLQGNDALYIRNYFGAEIAFIRDDLPCKYEQFILAHELGHAVLHVEIATAAYTNNLISKGKLERQADYFALKLLNIFIDEDYYEGYSLKQLASEFYITEACLKSNY